MWRDFIQSHALTSVFATYLAQWAARSLTCVRFIGVVTLWYRSAAGLSIWPSNLIKRERRLRSVLGSLRGLVFRFGALCLPCSACPRTGSFCSSGTMGASIFSTTHFHGIH